MSAGVATESWHRYYVDLTPGSTDLVVDLYNMTGDLDLYARHGLPRDLDNYDCRPYQGGTVAEECTFATPAEGRWHIGVNSPDIGTISYLLRAEWVDPTAVFSDSFESGDITVWTDTVP